MQGDITHIVDASGVVKAEYVYDAWGKCTTITGIDGIAELNPFRYRGYYYDTETGLFYLQNRYYDPETGRFLNMDDISYLDPNTINGLNLYAYCINNPVRYTDKSGKWFLIDDLISTVVGAIAGVVGQFVSDLTNSFYSGKWKFSSWETYFGAAIGGAVGGWTSLHFGPIVGAALGASLSTFIGQGLESLTGTKVRSIGEILGNSLISAIVAGASAIYFGGNSNFIQKTVGSIWNNIFKTFVTTFTLSWLFENLISGFYGAHATGRINSY